VLPLVIMIAVPAAAAGGVGGLSRSTPTVDAAVDMLTLLGFIILIGIVVNNATLTHQDALSPARGYGPNRHRGRGDAKPDQAYLPASRR
jgi:HAE1 family hydrophobic/amphiphilic exporter-1